MKDVNLIIMLLRCGGADGVDIYLGKKYLAAAEYIYEITKDDPDEIHNQFTDEEIEAIYKEDYNLFSKLFNERCGGHIDE